MRVYYLHPMITGVKEMLGYLHLNGLNYDLVWDENNPDILFVSEWIYYSNDILMQFKRLYEIAKIRVFLTYEAISPDWNLFDYGVGFDDQLQNSDRFIRLMSPFELYPKFVSSRKNNIESISQAYNELTTKTKFCNFLYSNPNAHPMRDALFYKISEYRKVDSLGRHLNNVETMGTGFVGHSMECVPMKRPYKFSIASENASYSGYTSEKILTSLEAHTVPIYFGNPNIVEDINPEAFINASEFNSLDDLLMYIKEVDSNDDLWCKYISSPWMTLEQENYHVQRTEEYRKKMEKLLSGAKSRIAFGTAQYMYRENFFNEFSDTQGNFIKNFKHKVEKAFRKLL